jgi:hypothetical protein
VGVGGVSSVVVVVQCWWCTCVWVSIWWCRHFVLPGFPSRRLGSC